MSRKGHLDYSTYEKADKSGSNYIIVILLYHGHSYIYNLI